MGWPPLPSAVIAGAAVRQNRHDVAVHLRGFRSRRGAGSGRNLRRAGRGAPGVSGKEVVSGSESRLRQREQGADLSW